MCNSNEDDGNCYLEAKSRLPVPGAICRKCKENIACIVLQIRDAYCRDCFLTLCAHKFRGILGKSRILHGNIVQPVLLAFSGSASSVALLKLVMDGSALDQPQRRLMAKPTILYIDEGAVTGEAVVEREKQCQSILSVVHDSGFPTYTTSLTLDRASPRGFQKSDNVDVTCDDDVTKLFGSLQDLTSKLDMLQRIRHKVLVDCAKELGIEKIFLAETATSLAAKILFSISIGRGAHLPLETGFLDNREENVVLIRPMKDFSSKEIAFFNRFNNLDSVFIPSLLTKTSIDDSIQRLTEDFVVSLQNEFPSTVSTIYRTGDKLQVPASDGVCSLCRGTLDTAQRVCSALEATEFSRDISTRKEAGSCHNTGQGCCGSKSGCSSQNVKLEDVNSELCYSCRLLARSMVSLEHLPHNILEKMKEQISFRQMKTQIQDFLIE